ncbi:unnamed protein product, partial [Aphanomyces euteiches]
VPQYTKKNIDLTHDEYLKIHNAPLLFEAAQKLYNVTERRQCGVDRQAYDSIEEYLEADNPFDFEDEELRRAKKKVRRMEEEMMGIEKRKKPSKTERRRMRAEAIADRKRRNAEIEEQRQTEEKFKAQRVEDNWTKDITGKIAATSSFSTTRHSKTFTITATQPIPKTRHAMGQIAVM